MFISDNWQDYELIDSGDGEKLERWGKTTVVRPEPAAFWPHEPWPETDAFYTRSGTGGGKWTLRRPLPDKWRIAYGLKNGPKLVFSLSSMGFKHTGVFPEQAANWDYLCAEVMRLKESGKSPRLLNLFAYTGGATLAMAAAHPAEIVHVDAAKGMLGKARDNLKLSRLDDVTVRFLADDAEKFVKREIRRGRRYDGIVLDPPTYGRGPGGEMWRLEEHLFLLLSQLSQLLPDAGPAFVLLNTYSGLTPSNAETCLKLALAKHGGTYETDELGLHGTLRGIPLSLGLTTRWTR